MIVSYLNFIFFTEVKAKTKYRVLNFVFKFIKKNETVRWVHGLSLSCSDFFHYSKAALIY